MLQKLETKQFQDLTYKAQYAKEQQDKKFEQEGAVCFSHDTDFSLGRFRINTFISSRLCFETMKMN